MESAQNGLKMRFKPVLMGMEGQHPYPGPLAWLTTKYADGFLGGQVGG